MWTFQALLISCFCVGFAFLSESSSNIEQCGGSPGDHGPSFHWSSDDDSCTSNSFPAKHSDVASVILKDLYKDISKAEQGLANPVHYPADYKPTDGEEFDFIVVGGGSAGAVVASRLSEVSSWKVLLVEAGGNPPKSSELPGLAPTLQLTDVDWQYKSEPEENICLGMENNSCSFPRGKMLGGSSSMNFMVYVRGNAKDYDDWAANGNTGWSYEEVLPYFKKSEDMRDSKLLAMDEAEKYHGKGGPLKIEPWTYSEADPLVDIVGKGLQELGYPMNVDYNGRRQTGFTRFHGTLQDHKRCSTAKAFLSPVKGRKNLKVAKHSLVSKVLIDKDSLSAIGVEFINKEGEIVRVTSKKEVVLSAGAINTAQILMLSGIGPKPILKQLDIPIINDLLVGQNLQDHPLMSSLLISVNYSVPPLDLKRSIFDYVTTGIGELTNMRATSYSAFVNIDRTDVDDYPDMQFIPVHFSKNSEEDVRGFFKTFNLKEQILNNFVAINREKDSVLLFGSMLRPFSRGQISLKNTDPESHPKIISGTLSDDRDVQLFLKTYDFMESLVKTKALKSIGAKLHEVRVPGCEKHPFPSREYRECSLRHLTATTYHYCGTCKMGPPSDPGAVVDPSLRVFGVKGLRVADASVMPNIVSGNINAAVIMIGEKASDLIKDTWRLR